MSATGRGASTGYVREPDDFFKTPAWCTRAILGHLCPDVEDTDLQLLDPCCGTGAILEAARDFAFSTSPVGLELHPGRAEEARSRGLRVITCDALKCDWPDADAVVINPPYALAMNFIEAGLAWLHEEREMAVLLRLCFMASAKRAAFWKARPADLYVLSERPSFCMSVKCKSMPPAHPNWIEGGCRWQATLSADAERPKKCAHCEGKVSITTSDAADYMWAVFGAGRTQRRWEVLRKP